MRYIIFCIHIVSTESICKIRSILTITFLCIRCGMDPLLNTNTIHLSTSDGSGRKEFDKSKSKQ